MKPKSFGDTIHADDFIDVVYTEKHGFCFHCDRPVEIVQTCKQCGGHDVDFMSPVVESLWEKLESSREG